MDVRSMGLKATSGSWAYIMKLDVTEGFWIIHSYE